LKRSRLEVKHLYKHICDEIARLRKAHSLGALPLTIGHMMA